MSTRSSIAWSVLWIVPRAGLGVAQRFQRVLIDQSDHRRSEWVQALPPIDQRIRAETPPHPSLSPIRRIVLQGVGHLRRSLDPEELAQAPDTRYRIGDEVLVSGQEIVAGSLHPGVNARRPPGLHGDMHEMENPEPSALVLGLPGGRTYFDACEA